MNSHEQALVSIGANDVTGFRTLLSELPANTHQGELLLTAANLGRTAMVADLIVVTDPKYFEEALAVAVRFEQEECTKFYPIVIFMKTLVFWNLLCARKIKSCLIRCTNKAILISGNLI